MKCVYVFVLALITVSWGLVINQVVRVGGKKEGGEKEGGKKGGEKELQSTTTPPDIDECTDLVNTHNCDANAACANTAGSFTCTCKDGYDGDGETCKDINECTDLVNTHNCEANARCTNTEGGFTCQCKDGYGDKTGSCLDIDECTDQVNTHNCDANANCANTEGGFNCTCKDGYYEKELTCKECTYQFTIQGNTKVMEPSKEKLYHEVQPNNPKELENIKICMDTCKTKHPNKANYALWIKKNSICYCYKLSGSAQRNPRTGKDSSYDIALTDC